MTCLALELGTASSLLSVHWKTLIVTGGKAIHRSGKWMAFKSKQKEPQGIWLCSAAKPFVLYNLEVQS